ncbi:hypothetical protein M9435_000502 [Picochlorum sp. BPE23]|nr:hypothetical protein M9435_000502 [Picochlorum sp. BPE23]
MPPKATSDGQELPTKEQALFRQLVKQYESKLYKKGLKTADAILKKCPTNGETLAMKGLLCNCLNRKEEAYTLVKEGVKNNLRSQVCWHVYGLLYRSDRNYDEAIKCYKNALRMEKDNVTVLRDLAQLQIQMRDIGGFLETRQRLLELKPTVRQSWVSLALAHHLQGNYDVAAVILEQYEATMDQVMINMEQYEHSEILLYKVSILKEGGKFEEALQALDKAEDARQIKDVISAMEIRAALLYSLNRYPEAAAVYRKLLKINMENYEYHRKYIAAVFKGQGEMGEEALEKCYTEDLRHACSNSTACKRLPLDFLSGQKFETALRVFVEPYLEKGIPSLFSELKPLYADKAKVEIIDKTLQDMCTKFTGKQSAWVYLCLAFHHCECGRFKEAFKAIDTCIELQPDLIEAHSAKSKILDIAGDSEGAALVADRARRMDLADRFLNCQASMALFKACKAEQAEEVSHLFTKVGDQGNNFYDMQATWYEISSGDCYLKLKDYGQALKRFKKVDEHFADFVEDQFDFHAYCLRKQTMRSYVDALRMLDNIYSNKTYALAVERAVGIYLHLFDNPQKSEEELLEERIASMSVEDAKKERQKLRKLTAKKKKQEESETVATKDAQGRRIDPDPKGERLLKTQDPLGEANKMVQNLLSGASDDVQSHVLAYRVHIRRNRALLALKHINKAIKLSSATAPLVHECIIDIARRVLTKDFQRIYDEKDSLVYDVVQERIEALIGGQDVAAYHQKWKSNIGKFNLESAFSAVKIDYLLDSTNKEDALQAFIKNLEAADFTGISHDTCEQVLLEMTDLLNPSAEILESYKKICANIFTYSRLFMGPDCIDISSLESKMEGLTM